MALYEYVGIEPGGKRVSGLLRARSVTEARVRLEGARVRIQSLDERALAQAASTFIEFITFSDLLTFYTSLSIALKAGASLPETLEKLGEQTPKRKMKRIMEGLIKEIESGKAFSDALRRHRDIFPKDFISLVAAAEQAGNLDEMLENYTSYTEKSQKIRSKAMGALMYPAMLVLVAVGVLIALTTLIFPQFIKSFGLTEDQLPELTRHVQRVSNFLIGYWWQLMLGVPAALYLGLHFLRSTTRGRKISHWLQFHTPVFGTLMRQFYISRFVRVLGTQLRGGVPGLSALAVTREVTDNVYFQRVIDEIMDSLKAGGTMTAALRRHPDIVPPIITLMFSIGERNGALETVLRKIGDYYDDVVGTATEGMVSIIEPLMIIVMGGIVSIVAISMFLPIFNLTKTMR